MRSAKPPMTSAGVMIAKVIWNMKKTVSGTVPDTEARVTPDRNALSRPPMNACSGPPSPKVNVYPTVSHRIDTTQVMAKHWIRIDNTFFDRTSPA